MFSQLSKYLLVGSTLVATCFVAPVEAQTNENPSDTEALATNSQVNITPALNSSNPGNREELAKSLSQLRSVQQLQDVNPYNWSYEALKNLVERYGCIVGYPDRTYRGNQPLTRYEFAAGLNACIEALERRMIELSKSQKSETTVATTGANTQEMDSIRNVFNRAFFHNSGQYWDIHTDPAGHLNSWFGWRSFPGSFMETYISQQGEILSTLYRDVMAQQSAGPNIRTPDLPNPFNTSLLENPNYASPDPTVQPQGNVDVIFQPGPTFR